MDLVVSSTVLHTEADSLDSPTVARLSEVVILGLLPAKEGQDGEYAAVIGRSADDVELAEEVLHVLLDCVLGDDQRFGDSAVGAAFGHECENFPLPRGELFEHIYALTPDNPRTCTLEIEVWATDGEVGSKPWTPGEAEQKDLESSSGTFGAARYVDLAACEEAYTRSAG